MDKLIKKIITEPKIQNFTPQELQNLGHGFKYKDKTFVTHTPLAITESAFYRFWPGQIAFFMFLLFFLLIGLIASWHTTIVVVLSILLYLYFADLLFNTFLIIRGLLKKPEISISDEELNILKDDSLPSYTILCPLYKEWEVIPQFVTAMSRLNYPRDKLQIILLLEEDDKDTLQKVALMTLPFYVEILVVPHSFPKTKPKACNYGLQKARGEYVVIFDAEDVPEPNQLKKAIISFNKNQDQKIGCVQAKLNFYNPKQNILTRLFTMEYSLWFDLTLTGMQSINAPIPLGGTSNHFRTDLIKKLQGWDAFNVTEDCDLGIRLAKYGYRTTIMDSETLEEANSDPKNWFFQRTRWIKGYIQTYFVHLRFPKDLITSLGIIHFFTFQFLVGGKILSMIINPLMWLTTLTYFLFRPQLGTFIESFFPGPMLYIGVFSAIFGNFIYLYNYMLACSKKGFYDLIKFGFLVPLYWIAMSAASWVALYKFIKQPHFWFKTTHGLYLSSNQAVQEAQGFVGNQNLIDSNLLGVKTN